MTTQYNIDKFIDAKPIGLVTSFLTIVLLTILIA